MKNVLVVYSSLNQNEGNSTRLTNSYLEALRQHQEVQVSSRDLVEMGLGHLTAEEMQAWGTAEEDRTDKQRTLAQISDKLVEEVQAADEIVLAVPMYNFGVPSILKAWFDRIARAGVTFNYTENGPVGLLKDKQVTVLAARGGVYHGTELDTQSAYLRHFFAFIGIDDIRMIYAEGLAMGEDTAQKSFAQANEKIIELTA